MARYRIRLVSLRRRADHPVASARRSAPAWGVILSLLVSSDGTLWIGGKGLASWKNDKLTEYPEIGGQFIYALREDREGTVWVGTGGAPLPGRLCAIRSGSVHCHGEDGGLGRSVMGLYEDRSGNLWAASKTVCGNGSRDSRSSIHYPMRRTIYKQLQKTFLAGSSSDGKAESTALLTARPNHIHQRGLQLTSTRTECWLIETAVYGPAR